MSFTLDRVDVAPRLIGNPDDFLFVSSLAGATRDIVQLTNDGANAFGLGGVMGMTLSIGLGLALARRDRNVMVVAGDGDILMGVGTLATIAVKNPPNLAILCVDNGLYQETGSQQTPTASVTDIEKMAIGAGLGATLTVKAESEIAAGARLLRDATCARLVVVRVSSNLAPRLPRVMDAAVARARFKAAVVSK